MKGSLRPVNFLWSIASTDTKDCKRSCWLGMLELFQFYHPANDELNLMRSVDQQVHSNLHHMNKRALKYQVSDLWFSLGISIANWSHFSIWNIGKWAET